MSVSYELFTREDATRRQLTHVAGLMLAEARELRPVDPHPTVDELADELAAGWWSSRRTGYVLGTAGGTGIGYAKWRLDVEDDPDGVDATAYVTPGWRRRGVGSTLFTTALDEAERRHGVSRAEFWIRMDSPLAPELSDLFERAWGLPVKMVERVARLDLASVRHARVAAEVASRLARHTGHQAVFFEMDEVPERLPIEDFAALMEEVMNLMPFEGLAAHHESYTPERFLEGVAVQRSVGRTLWHLVMVERDTGRPVAVTVVSFKPSDPRWIEQWDTGVAADAQGKGLGKTAKLWMLEKVLTELPGAWFIETENAHSNAAMIAINDALGFREHAIGHAYQLPLGELRRHLGWDSTSR
jgi:GNAT superfamily N-acetyltransferase